MTRCVAVGVAIAAACAACWTGSGALVVTGGTLIDGTGAPPVQGAVLVVDGGRIACAGSASSCEVPDGARQLDATGLWLTPGLFDTHIHPRFRQRPRRALRDQRLRFLMGVTSTRDAGTYGDVRRNLAEMPATRDPRSPVPRLVVSARLGLEVESAAQAARVTAGAARGGANAIKIGDDLTDSTLRWLGRAADSLGLPTYGHAWQEGPLRSRVIESLDAGFEGLSHVLGIAPLALPADYLDRPPAPTGDPEWLVWRHSLWADADADSLGRVATTLARRGIWLEPLLVGEALWADAYGVPVGLHRLLELPFVVARLRDPGDRAGLTEEGRVRARISMECVREFTRAFHEAGGVLVTGSDEFLAPGLAIHEEMRQLVLAGLTPADALAAATREAARAVGVSDSLGTLERGKIADFLLLEGDPLADIANAQLVYAVVKGGVPYNPASLFDDLADDLSQRTSSPVLRLLGGLLAVAVVAGVTILVIRRHRASLPTSWRA